MTTRISHWIDGARPGRLRPLRRRLQPRDRRADRRGRPRLGRRGRRRGRQRRRGRAASWRHASLSRRAAVLFAFRELLHARTDELAEIITAEHGKVLSDADGEIARGLENVEFACGVAAPAQGRLLRAGRAPASTSTRSASRSASSPASRRSTSRRWCRCGCAPTRSPAATRSSSSRARRTRRPRSSSPSCGRRPACRTASSPSSTATRRPSTRSSTTPTSPRSASSARPRSPATSTRPAPRNGKRVQALGGAKNHMVVLPDADVDMAADAAVSAAYGSAGERCMAISVVVAVGDVGRPAGRRDRRPAAQARASATAPTPTPRWAR